ncbi:MAG: hypothetical protein QNJ14_04310 [Woeseiaceae bacterium]|nr:hypothetical protein [Woeseiaceae bacterium]
MNPRVATIVSVFLLVAVAGFVYIIAWLPPDSNDQLPATDEAYTSKGPANDGLAPNLAAVRVSDPPAEETKVPKELVSSIYDRGLEFREMATSAAENLIQHYPRESYNRWAPVRIDPFSIMNGSYLDEGAMPETISVTPFPDVSFVADQTRYTVMEESHGAVWRGKIRGSDVGEIEVSIVSAFETPAFVIRVMNFPNPTIVIAPTGENPVDSPDLYMAVESNLYVGDSLD